MDENNERIHDDEIETSEHNENENKDSSIQNAEEQVEEMKMEEKKPEEEKEVKTEVTLKPKEEFVSKKSFVKTIILAVVCSILLSGVTTFAAVSYVMKNKSNETVVVYSPVAETHNTVSTTSEPDLTDVVEQISNSIVEVYTEAVVHSTFYGEYVTEGAGSGVVYTSNGYIITNNHVIESATAIKVKLNDGTEYDAELVATDSVSDIAILKVDAEGLQPAILGDSDSLKVAQECIAIGNPLGTLGGTVTNGIISALSREITIDGQKMTLLQTNTSINPGNSGGGLFNVYGELIGIVNAKSSGSDIEGIGFAIPINYVKEIAEQLITNGYVIGRPALGITCVSIDSIQKAWNYGVSSYGVYVSEINNEETANSGLQKGDVIVAINDVTISSFTELKTALNNYSAGDTVELTVIRNRDTVKINVVLQQKTQ